MEALDKPRVALVTGGSRGIGAATCLALAEQGMDVAINYHANADAAERIAAQVRGMGRQAEIFAADLGSESEVEVLAASVLDRFGPVGILVNNGGFGSEVVGRPLVSEMRADHLDLMMRIHVYAPVFLCRALLPTMRMLNRGDVIMVSSQGVQSLGPRMGTYIAAKAAMEAIAGVLAREEREHGIRVNIVSPGLTDTDMGRGLIDRMSGGIVDDNFDANMPFGFVCQPTDVAAAIAYLVSDKGRYVTGQRLSVDGGSF